ncbi:MAG: hypothetical protein AAFN92_01265 [Bacteroidota bacterium]
MNLRTFLSLLALTCCLLGCNDNKPAQSDTDQQPISPTDQGAIPLPSIDQGRLEFLWNNATYMDATFYDLPISINQSNLDQIRSTIATVAAETMPLPAGAKPLGHIWFQVNGKNVEEADIYFQDDAVGYVWYENNRPAYSNRMTQDGVLFYNNIIQSVPGQQQQQQ